MDKYISHKNEYKNYENFKTKWAKLKKKVKVPNWYLFDPENPEEIADDHNMIKRWDAAMFDFLKEQKWMEAEKDLQGRLKYEEKSEFVINCSQLLGIGGEGIAIRKSVSERLFYIPESLRNEKYEALKIIPILEENFQDKENVNKIDDYLGQEKEASFAETFLAAAEYIELTEEEDTEINDIKHSSLMEYSKFHLDFIKTFDKKVFVLTLGKLIFSELLINKY